MFAVIVPRHAMSDSCGADHLGRWIVEPGGSRPPTDISLQRLGVQVTLPRKAPLVASPFESDRTDQFLPGGRRFGGRSLRH